jgi:hypothetical protein
LGKLDAEAGGTAATTGTLRENAASAGKEPAAIRLAMRARRIRFKTVLLCKN